MKKLALITGMSLVSLSLWAATEPTPAGYWKTIDDKTGEAQSIVQIYKTKEGVYNGKIKKSLGKQTNPNERCVKCPEPFTDKPVQNLEFLWGFKQEQNNPMKYTNGKVLDPRSGDIYSANMTVKEDGQILEFRGYLGIPMLGRSQHWERTQKPK